MKKFKTKHLFLIVLFTGFYGCSLFVKAPVMETPGLTRPAGESTELFASVDSPEARKLKSSIAAAGDYLVRNQLSNGELPYKVDLADGRRSFSPSHVRLIAGTGSLYTAARVTGDTAYILAGDGALDCYLDRLIDDRKKFEGACLYTKGYCKLGGEALAVDAIYRRWQATGNTSMGERDLLDVARQLGEHIVWMRNPTGGFFHRMDPFEGVVDRAYYVRYFNGEALMALLELYEMTGNVYWLEHARAVHTYMKQQPVSEDHWHGYAFHFMARLNMFTPGDQAYAEQIARAIIRNTTNLEIDHSSISTATKVEALAAIALAFQIRGISSDWLGPAIGRHAGFVMARQLPDNVCGWKVPDDINRGGIYRNCEDPFIRVDALQHWINGAALYLEYMGRVAN